MFSAIVGAGRTWWVRPWRDKLADITHELYLLGTASYPALTVVTLTTTGSKWLLWLVAGALFAMLPTTLVLLCLGERKVNEQKAVDYWWRILVAVLFILAAYTGAIIATMRFDNGGAIAFNEPGWRRTLWVAVSIIVAFTSAKIMPPASAVRALAHKPQLVAEKAVHLPSSSTSQTAPLGQSDSA